MRKSDAAVFAKVVFCWYSFLFLLALPLTGCHTEKEKTADPANPVPPLPIVTVVINSSNGIVNIISACSVIRHKEPLDEVLGNAAIFSKGSPVQKAYKLHIINAVYDLCTMGHSPTNVYIVSNNIASNDVEIANSPWMFDFRRFAYCSNGPCFIFGTNALAMRGDCNCYTNAAMMSASDWPRLYLPVNDEVSKWF